ncbi:effector-associated domain EAD1-containing protein [Streptomyces sp. NPDC091280]|uniref:effector-associated domain EAD1-containing protein n=1 Tax=unclassified Streptomyces TaxID=2593676 RepID=UPI0037F6613D
MAGATWIELREAGAFELLGELFPDVLSSHAFLEDVGISPALLPAFGPPLPAEGWWRAVCRTVDQGRFAAVPLDALLDAASARHPGNARLRALAGRDPDGGTADVPLRVLCLMAGPLDEARLRLGAEQRVIREAEARSAGRLAVTVHPATRVGDILPQLDAVLPRIVHFAGHGTDDGKLLFEDASGISTAVPVEALLPALALHAPLSGVVLNSCWTAAYAEGLLDCAHCVIGTRGELGDEAGLAFAEGFYGSLAHSPSVGRAAESGRAALRLRGHSAADVLLKSRTGQAV